MVWPKSGSITSSDTSSIRSTSAIEVAGISGRLRRFREQPCRQHHERGLADSDAWMLRPISVIQRREPYDLGAEQQRRHDQRDAETANTISAERADQPWRQERHRDQHHKGRQQKQYVAVEEVKRIEPDPCCHRRTRRQRQNDAAQHQRDNRREQQAVDASTTTR